MLRGGSGAPGRTRRAPAAAPRPPGRRASPGAARRGDDHGARPVAPRRRARRAGRAVVGAPRGGASARAPRPGPGPPRGRDADEPVPARARADAGVAADRSGRDSTIRRAGGRRPQRGPGRDGPRPRRRPTDQPCAGYLGGPAPGAEGSAPDRRTRPTPRGPRRRRHHGDRAHPHDPSSGCGLPGNRCAPARAVRVATRRRRTTRAPVSRGPRVLRGAGGPPSGRRRRPSP